MTYDEAMSELKARGNEQTRKVNAKNGAGDNQFGVKMGDLRVIAKAIKTDPGLATQLWASGNLDAMFLATLIMKPKQLSVDDLEQMLKDVTTSHLADWVGTNVVKLHPAKEAQREKWMNSAHEVTARMGWSLTAERIIKNPEGLDIKALLDRLEHEMGAAPTMVQWTMNYCLAEIGIRFPEHRARAIAIGEKIGAFKDYPTPKGCTSPYAPLWIAEMVKRGG